MTKFLKMTKLILKMTKSNEMLGTSLSMLGTSMNMLGTSMSMLGTFLGRSATPGTSGTPGPSSGGFWKSAHRGGGGVEGCGQTCPQIFFDTAPKCYRVNFTQVPYQFVKGERVKS